MEKWLKANEIEEAGYYWFLEEGKTLDLIAIEKKYCADGSIYFSCWKTMSGAVEKWSFDLHTDFGQTEEVSKKDLFMLIERPSTKGIK
jgi:hypothetical protein